MCRKIVMFVSFILLVAACGSSSTAAGLTPAAPTATAASWQTYSSAEGEFSIAYPPDYTLYQNQVPSIDGVLADAPNAIALQRSSEPSFVLSIIYRPTDGTLSPAELAALDDACVAGSPSQSLTLGDQAFQTLMFKDTPCGPHGSTVIYVNSGVMGYRIMIETQADYQSVQAEVNPILDTLMFRVSEESSDPEPIREATCTAPVKFTATDGKISYSGISFEINPALAEGITAQDCPAVPYREDLDPGAAHPAYTSFTFGGFRPWVEVQPELRVYEVSGGMSPYLYPLNMLDELQQATTQKPEPAVWFDGAALHVHADYINFQSGAGVRGVVQYAQDVFFFTNNGLTYAFDGLTQDGRYYVSVRVPVAVPFLMEIERSDPSTNSNPQAIPIPEWPADYEQQRQIIEAYNQEALRRFNELADADIAPDIAELDAFVGSIKIGEPTISDLGSSTESPQDAAELSAAIEQAMLESMRAKGAPTENARIEVQEIADGYARVHVYYDVANRPGIWDQGFAYFEDGAWKAWAFGSGIAQEHVEAAGIPRSVWPDGWLTASAERDSCPESAADTRLLTNTRQGYCLLYPVEYKMEKPNASETVLVIGGLLNVQDPRVNIVVEETSGRTAEALAEAVAADVASAFPGFNVERSSITVGGVEAILLDKLPGQDLNRRVFFEHDGLLYQLTFSPADENAGDAYRRMEALYDIIVDSFTFIPVSTEVIPGEECLEAKAEEQLLTNEAYNFCLLVPTGYDVDEPAENQIVLYAGSLLDVAHPKVFIEVQDAAGRAAEQIADELASEVQGSMPGYNVERSFGLGVGYEAAWVLENMPGQDISRQVVVVHEDQLYKLTFIPADEQAGELYTQMESLYTTVINSFRFLR